MTPGSEARCGPVTMLAAASLVAALVAWASPACTQPRGDATRAAQRAPLPVSGGTDYRSALAGGGLVPDTIVVDGIRACRGMSEAQLDDLLGAGATVVEAEEPRDRARQHEWLRALAAKRPGFVYYYPLVDRDRDTTLTGTFWVKQWRVADLAVRACFVRQEPGTTSRAWLLEVLPDPVPAARVQFVTGHGLTVLRTGNCRARWDLDHNRLEISRPAVHGARARR